MIIIIYPFNIYIIIHLIMHCHFKNCNSSSRFYLKEHSKTLKTMIMNLLYIHTKIFTSSERQTLMILEVNGPIHAIQYWNVWLDYFHCIFDSVRNIFIFHIVYMILILCNSLDTPALLFIIGIEKRWWVTIYLER